MLATFEALKQYEKTFHFIGQVQIALDSEKPRQASAYVYTIAHHVITKENGEKSLMIAYLRYDDSFEKTESGWKFKHRELHADVIEHRDLK
ncbi:nuclear transport factor 2 family protein [Lactococcus cremoris]|uniref:nuclear transport factor 2 family protein n=1 Tax=Lactococcus lactis subsp. cremoris TaxID=1359 RepID=UPI002FC929BA